MQQFHILFYKAVAIHSRSHAANRLKDLCHSRSVVKSHAIGNGIEVLRGLFFDDTLHLIHLELVYPCVEVLTQHIIKVLREKALVKVHLFCHLINGKSLGKVRAVASVKPTVDDDGDGIAVGVFRGCIFSVVGAVDGIVSLLLLHVGTGIAERRTKMQINLLDVQRANGDNYGEHKLYPQRRYVKLRCGDEDGEAAEDIKDNERPHEDVNPRALAALFTVMIFTYVGKEANLRYGKKINTNGRYSHYVGGKQSVEHPRRSTLKIGIVRSHVNAVVDEGMKVRDEEYGVMDVAIATIGRDI